MTLRMQLALVLALAWNDANAATLYQSVAYSPTPSGAVISDAQYSGIRFFLDGPVDTQGFGGTFSATASTSPVFGALIALDSPTDFPDSMDLSSADVLGHGLLMPPSSGPAVDVTIPLATRLEGGWYAILFGSGQFGASGYAAWNYQFTAGEAPEADLYFFIGPDDVTGIFTWQNLDRLASANEEPLAARAFLVGAAVPLPAAAWLFAGTLGALGLMKRGQAAI